MCPCVLHVHILCDHRIFVILYFCCTFVILYFYWKYPKKFSWILDAFVLSRWWSQVWGFLIGRCFMGCGTSVSKPSFLGLVLLSWWKSVCFLNKKMFPQVIVHRTNTMHNCFFSYRICIYVPNSSSGILSSVDIIKYLFKEHFIVLP